MSHTFIGTHGAHDIYRVKLGVPGKAGQGTLVYVKRGEPPPVLGDPKVGPPKPRGPRMMWTLSPGGKRKK